jgi:general stress protein 26
MSRTDAEVDRLLAGAARTVREVRYCWLVTGAGEGGLNARPMGHLPLEPGEDAWTIRFVVDGRSRKVADLQRGDKVALVFQHDGKDAYVTLSGRAALRADAVHDRRHWKAAYGVYFPTERDLAHAAFIEVEVACMELWIRGVTPEPFGLRPSRLERDAAGAWRLVSDERKAAA